MCCSLPSAYRPSSRRAEQRLLGGGGLVLAVAAQHHVGGAVVLDLQHGAGVLLVRRLQRLGDDAVQAGALELRRTTARPRPGRWWCGSGGRARRGRPAPPPSRPGARRTGRSTNDSSPSASRSKATYDAGVFSASMVIRDSAGWIRSWRVSNSSRDSPAPPSATNSSPSSTHRSGSCSRAAATTSGKYRVSGFVFRDASSTSSPSLNTRHRNPSHFGSNDSPPNFPGSGIPFTGFANIGCTGGITGRSMPRP